MKPTDGSVKLCSDCEHRLGEQSREYREALNRFYDQLQRDSDAYEAWMQHKSGECDETDTPARC